MSLTFARMFTYLTLLAYLVVGTVAVRLIKPETSKITLSTSYLTIFNDSKFNSIEVAEISAPEMNFDEIKQPTPIKKIAVTKPAIETAVKEVEVTVDELPVAKSESNELPFHEPVELQAVTIEGTHPSNLVALYQDFKYSAEELVASAPVEDQVSSRLAANEETEPEFFEYPNEAKKVADKPVEKVAAVKEETTPEPEFFDYQDTQKEAVAQAAAVPTTVDLVPGGQVTPAAKVPADYSITKVAATAAPVSEEVSVADLVAFDYPKAQADILTQKTPTVSTVSKPSKSQYASALTTQGMTTQKGLAVDKEKVEKEEVQPIYQSSLTVQAVGTDLVSNHPLKGFELRAQDDLSEAIEDFNTGDIKMIADLSQPKMTRSMTLLKRGYIPTSTDLILEEGDGSVSIPLIEEEKFNDIQKTFERSGSFGAVLVELDDESELAQLDVKFGDVIKLDGNMKQTDSDDFRYQLFVGVKAGNAMLTYKRPNGDATTKIIHVHEHEVTFDANFYEDVVDEKIRLFEEDLLAKETSPLIVSGEQVKVFATNRSAKKVNNHTYKMEFGSVNLGGRRYIELNHQAEPVFIGVRDNNNVIVPSESFMRYILSSSDKAQAANRCVVQVNLTKKAEKLEIGTESEGASLETYTQVLDNDGKFYDSLSSKSKKIIIVGEHQGASGVSQDSKINIKIQYLDGSLQFLNSYCSPNTYLVEQL